MEDILFIPPIITRAIKALIKMEVIKGSIPKLDSIVLEILSIWGMFPEPKVINLPPIYDKLYKKRKPTVVLPETTDIKHVSSVNIGNNYMRKTPKIHGIRL